MIPGADRDRLAPGVHPGARRLGSWSGIDDDALEAAAEGAPLTASLTPGLRDWSRGMEEGLLALLEGLEARRSE